MNRRRVLLADDSVTIQKVIELTFMDSDIQVVSVSNGEAALAKLDELDPDLLITDIHMPGLSGYDICRRAKERRPDLPVMLLVGTFEPFDEAEAQAAGSDAVLKKPFDSQELQRLVSELASPPPPPVPFPSFAAAPEPPAPPAEVEDEGELDRWDALQIGDVPDSLPEERPSEQELEAVALSGNEPVWGNLDDLPAADLEPEPPAFGGAWETEAVAEPLPTAVAAGSETVMYDRSEAFAVLPEAPLPDWAEPASEVPSGLSWEEPAVTPEPPPEVAAEPPAAAPAATVAEATPDAAPASFELSDADVDRIARRVVELMGEKTVRDVAWEVVPDLAEVVIKERLSELERQLEQEVGPN